MTMKVLLASAAVALAFMAAGSASAASSVVYLAPEDTSSLYGNNQIGFSGNSNVNGGGAYGVGNTITLAGPGRLTTVDLFGYAGGGSKPIEVDLYSGANPNTGTLLGSEQVTPTGNGWTTEVLNFGNLAIPQTLTYIISIVGDSGSYDDSFVNWQQFTGVTGSPTIGVSGDMWYGNGPGSFVVDNAYAIATGAATNTLAVQFNVPEPATWAMLCLGFVALGFTAFRRDRSARAIV